MIEALSTHLLQLLTFVAATISTVTDSLNGKIYNRILMIILFIGLPLIFFQFKINDNTCQFSTNIVFAVILSLLLYSFKVWAAGDAKLMILLAVLFPLESYGKYSNAVFPSFTLFILTFATAFVYIVGESIILSFKNFNLLYSSLSIITRESGVHIKQLLGSLSFGMLIIYFLNNCYGIIFNDIYFLNIYIFNAFNFFILLIIYSYIKNKKIYFLLLLIAMSDVIISKLIVNNLGLLLNFDIFTILLPVIVFILKVISDTFNYEEITISEVEKGMVLSTTSSIVLSRYIKDILLISDETTKSRLTAEQAENIKKLSYKGKQEMKIKIVRLMPFAIFILIGLILAFIFGKV